MCFLFHDRLPIALEEKVISLERLRTLDSSESALAALRHYINRPAAMFDKYEAVELLQLLLHLARNENRQKADEYAAALDEIKTRSDFVDDQQLQCLFLGLLGDPVQAKVAKDANAILKGVGKAPPPPMPVRPGSAMRRPAPYPGRAQVQCFRCLRWGHITRACRAPQAGRQFGRGRVGQ